MLWFITLRMLWFITLLIPCLAVQSYDKMKLFLESTTSSYNKFPISIEETFSIKSDVTVVITSCNRFDQLQATLNSFFHFNTYLLRQMILVEDCNGDTSAIWKMLPLKSQEYSSFFTVLSTQPEGSSTPGSSNVGKAKGNLGQIQAIDKAYKQVKTKYLFHLEDDWLQLCCYGFIERMIEVLQNCQARQLKVSQAVLTFPSWTWTHMPGPQLTTVHGIHYHTLTSYGKQYLYSFSFNPHLINYEQIYKKLVEGSYIQSIARKYHCLNEESTSEMENGGCVEFQLGKYFSEKGYRQVWAKLSVEPIYEHIGTNQWLPRQMQDYSQIKQDANNNQIYQPFLQKLQLPIIKETEIKNQPIFTKVQDLKPQNNEQQNKQKQFFSKIGLVLIISLISFTIFYVSKKLCKNQQIPTKTVNTATYMMPGTPFYDDQQLDN